MSITPSCTNALDDSEGGIIKIARLMHRVIRKKDIDFENDKELAK